MIIIPLLTMALGVDIRYAIGASLVSVIATSSGAAAAYVREGFSNIRIGMFLEIATTLGALGGAAIALRVAPWIIAVIFGCVLLYSAWQTLRAPPADSEHVAPDALATRLAMNGTFPAPGGHAQLQCPLRPRQLRPDGRSGRSSRASWESAPAR